MKTFPAILNKRLIVLFVLGFCAIPAQVVLMREFILAFAGNELIIGLFLAIWMLLTAGGSFAARFLRLRQIHVPVLALFLCWFPLVLLYGIDLTRNWFFLPGIEPGIIRILAASTVVLLPFCFLSGLLFANTTRLLTGKGGKSSAEHAYGMESAGSMAGGLLFSLALVYLYDNFRASAVMAALGSAMVLLSCQEWPGRYTRTVFSMVTTAAVILVLFAGSLAARQFLFPNQELMEVKDTPYGNLAVTRTSGQLNLYENNVLLYSTDNIQASEEAVHFAMLQHPGPQNVLLLSGGIAGLTGEVLKYKSVRKLDYVEIDPVIPDIGKKYTGYLSDPRISIIERDPRIHIRSTPVRYDVVIVYLPEPSSFQLNRFYTVEFMKAVKQRLTVDGILTFSLPITGNYLNEGSRTIYSSLRNTANSQFQNVGLFPGMTCHFVASDGEIKNNIGQLIDDKAIITDYVNSYYIDQPEMERLAQTIASQLQSDASINTDFNPVAVSGFYQYWLNRFRMDIRTFNTFMVFLVILVVAGAAAASPSYSGMFAAGFTSTALQVILILSFQIVYGYIYRTIGLFTAVFMAGLAMGALLRGHIIRTVSARELVSLQLALAGLSALIPFLISLSTRLIQMPFLVHLVYLTAIGLVSLATGIVFSISANAPDTGSPVNIAVLYGSDLAGASLGALTTTLVLIPMAGITHVPYQAGLLNMLIAVIMIIRNRFRK